MERHGLGEYPRTPWAGMKPSKVTPRFKKPKGLPLLPKWRKYRNEMTQDQLAERSGVTQGMISHLENGNTDFTGNMLERLAFALQCEPPDLIMRDPTDSEAPWTIWETLKPAERRQAVEILKALKRASGE